jgi:hypothetical protein
MIDIGPGQAPLTPDGCMSLAQVVGALPASLWTRPGMATFEQQRARWVGVAAHVRGLRPLSGRPRRAGNDQARR